MANVFKPLAVFLLILTWVSMARAQDDPVINYNEGVSSYRKADFKHAKDLFTKSLATENKTLEKKAEYNIGNSLFKIAGTKEAADTEGAIDSLKQAIHYYQQAINHDAKDLDAKYNCELSQKLLKILLEKPKPPQSQKQNNSQNQQNQQDKQQNQQQNQPKDQQGQGDQQKNQDNQQKQRDGQNKKENQPASEQQEKDKSSRRSEENKLSQEEARMLASQYGKEDPRLDLNRDQNSQQKTIEKDW